MKRRMSKRMVQSFFCGMLFVGSSLFAEKTVETNDVTSIVVTASRIETEAGDVPADVTVFSTEQLDLPGTKNVMDALQSVPGIRVESRQNNGIFGNGVVIRGLSANATSGGSLLYVIDGVPQRRLSFGGPYYGALPHSAVNRMELVKGALTTQYGRGAMCGTLQMLTAPEDKDKLSAELGTMYESETDFFQQTLKGNIPLDSLYGGYAAVSMSHDEANGWQRNTPSHHGDLWINLGLNVSEVDFINLFGGVYSGRDKVATQLFVDKNGRLEPYMRWDGNLSPNNHNYVDLEEQRIGASWRRWWSDQLESKLTTAYWKGDTEWGVNRPWTKPVGYGVGNSLITDVRYMTLQYDEQSVFNEAMLTWRYDVSDTVCGSLSGGANYEKWFWNNKSWNYGKVQYDPATGFIDTSALNFGVAPAEVESDVEFWGPFLINSWKLGERVDLQAGIRYDHYRNEQQNKVSGVTDVGTQTFVSPSIGGVLHVVRETNTMVDVYANWGRNYNPVTRTGVNAGILDAPPEESETVEAGVRTKLFDGLVESGVAVFRVDRTDVPQIIGGVYQRSDDWSVEGVEISLAIHPAEALTFYSSLAFSDPVIDKSEKTPALNDNQIMFASRRVFSFGGDYRHESGLGCGFQTRYTGKTYADSANTVHIPSFWITDTQLSYLWKNAEIAFFVNNLFDERYFSGAFDDSSGFVFAGTPRTMGVSAKLKF